MKQQIISEGKEALERALLLMKYDSKKTLTENKQTIFEQPDSVTNLSSVGLGAIGAGTGFVAGSAVATGAAMGTTVFPVVGTAVGALLGLGLGALGYWMNNKDRGADGFKQIMEGCNTKAYTKLVPQLSKSEVRSIAYNIEDSKGTWDDDEDTIIAELQKIPGAKKATDILFGTNIFSLLGKLAEEETKSKAGTKANLEPRSASRVYVQQLRLENKIIRDTNKARADELAKLKAKSEVDKLKDKFDIERIGLTLALNQATDEETKLRLRAQLAILDNNEALAKKYNAELGAVAAANALATSATTAAGALNFLASGMPALFNSLGELTGRGRNQIAPDEFARLPQGVTNMGAQTAATAAATAQTTATLTLDPNASSDKLVAAIGELVRVNLKYGNKLVPAGTIQ